MTDQGNFTAVVMGGTGACGRYIVAELLKRDDARVITLGRRAPTNPPGYNLDYAALESSGKLTNITGVNFEDPSTYIKHIQKADVVLSALASTRKEAGSAEQFIRIDQTFVVGPAQETARQAPSVRHFAYISALNADEKSWFLYPKTKGQTERLLKESNLPSLSIFRPGFIHRQGTDRFVEKALGFVSWLMPSCTDYQVGQAVVADAVKALNEKRSGVTEYSNAGFLELIADREPIQL